MKYINFASETYQFGERILSNWQFASLFFLCYSAPMKGGILCIETMTH